ncbi:MAG: CdaR family transcriptional regulator [Pleomorphochaeta sp.]
MELSKTDAQEIVKEISQLLKTKINIMNNKGIIIASSNENRINTFHEGAYKIITNKLSELEVQEKDSDLQGTYQGLNFPIEFNNEIIGVVGITGTSEKTRAYGNIVKKMTEILVEGKAKDEEKRNKELIKSYFLIDWIASDNTPYNLQLIQRGLDLNINIEKARRIIALDIFASNQQLTIDLEKKIINKIYSLNTSNLIFKESNYIIIATEELEKNTLNNQLSKIINLTKSYNAKIYIGISSIIKDFYNINIFYKNAKHALKIQRSKNVSGFSYYNDLAIELIYEHIPTSTKTEIINKIFSKYNNENIEKPMEILKTYFEFNGSIKRAASKLNMHSNTLQYHLNKIKEDTNLDPRNIKDSLLFQLCIDFFYQLNNKNN